jgi:uncharacterized protein YfaS (alpha-2-macroglobulin family)
MEGAIGAPLRTDLLDPVPAHASSVTVQVDRAHDVTSDDNLPITVSVQSKGQIETISLTVNLTDKSITIN